MNNEHKWVEYYVGIGPNAVVTDCETKTKDVSLCSIGKYEDRYLISKLADAQTIAAKIGGIVIEQTTTIISKIYGGEAKKEN